MKMKNPPNVITGLLWELLLSLSAGLVTSEKEAKLGSSSITFLVTTIWSILRPVIAVCEENEERSL